MRNDTIANEGSLESLEVRLVEIPSFLGLEKQLRRCRTNSGIKVVRDACTKTAGNWR